ncbi:CDP-diacylglycerol--glycerol-3-phosphate 3-phosphatidyltransferase [Candidatus Nanopelagicus hibericus]|uniref:CDP-diacylglycerol--glycerol-3-phosphate 3-phosphatidyltransferase n=1 Tax=Candidatus Nanopelagicus hibericus TaxID=1884915 RepID=A0A249K9N9_9ACTN|nr:CDP-alcohol phosphatidyltransferase family protein [Candidatus Nanopelagicus hibericus]ASY13445.1 CDP-diacylglycerol--glycerol-3-phosphate 3-phosphatidyltransferase [Candidatus Nanopelagicus hibericus]
MNKSEFLTAWSKLHGDAQVSGVVKAWLNISYLISKPLSRIGVTPNALTISGLFFGIILYLYAQTIWAPILLVISLICDGIDGSLAILTGKNSKWGALLDSLADRITELFWVLALYKIGVGMNLLIAVLLIASVQEYLRARAGGLGVNEVGVVTPAERPVRASFIFVLLIAFQFGIEMLNEITFIWLILQCISLFMVSRFAYRKLS